MIPSPLRLASVSTALAAATLLATSVFHANHARAADTTPAQQLARFNAEAATPGHAERGRRFFVSRHAGQWSCASCHGEAPLMAGTHASTGKAIDPLAPAANPLAFTDTAKVDKWFRRNCRDVAKRECTPAEKADVLAYLIGLKP